MTNKHVFNFKTYNEYRTAKRNCFAHPNVSYVKEKKKIYINSNYPSFESAEVGDIVAFGTNGNRVFIKQDVWNENLREKFTPEAVVVIPSSHTQDGTIRAMSLKNMSVNAPLIGTIESEKIMFGNETEGLKQYQCVVTSSESNERQTYYAYNEAFGAIGLPIGEEVEDEYEYKPNDCDSYYKNVEGITKYNRAPSPYNPTEEKCELYRTTEVSNCLSDLDGYQNTENILNLMGDNRDLVISDKSTTNEKTTEIEGEIVNIYPSVIMCKKYSTPNLVLGSWYLPSIGELGYLVSRLGKVNDSLNRLISEESTEDYSIDYLATEIKDDTILSSTASDNNKMWVYNNGKFMCEENDNNFIVRAFVKLTSN